MNRKEIIDKLSLVFRKILNNESLILTNELTANDVDNWDSLSHMLLIDEIENAFSVKFKLRELNKMKNVGALIDILLVKLN